MRDLEHRPANDLVRRNFFVEKPNELWVADITFLPTIAGFLFLAVVMDAWSRRIVGWAFSADLKTRVVLDALDMALATRKPHVLAAQILGIASGSIGEGPCLDGEIVGRRTCEAATSVLYWPP